MTIAHRFVEACALLPMLYVQPAKRNIVFCSGPCAELFAVDVLRWRDVAQVFVPEPSVKLRDPRVVVGKPPVGACSAVLLSPDENPESAAAALTKDGVLNACTRDPVRFAALLKLMRRLFPRSVSPWREHLPEVLYGALASPQGAPKRLRNPPGGARRITAQYLPCLFTFGGDEMPTVFGPVEPTIPLPAQAPSVPVPVEEHPVANLFNALLSQAKAQVGNIVSGPVAPDTLRSFLRAQPAYVDNRERAAVVLDKGFKAYDTYVAYKMPIFIGSVVGAIGSATMLTKRRGHGSEAIALWSLSFAACSLAAWFTRPGTVAAAPANLTGTDKTDYGVVATIDSQREKMRQENPAFADDVFNRLAGMPGIREQLAQNPLVRAAVV